MGLLGLDAASSSISLLEERTPFPTARLGTPPGLRGPWAPTGRPAEGRARRGYIRMLTLQPLCPPIPSGPPRPPSAPHPHDASSSLLAPPAPSPGTWDLHCVTPLSLPRLQFSREPKDTCYPASGTNLLPGECLWACPEHPGHTQASAAWTQRSPGSPNGNGQHRPSQKGQRGGRGTRAPRPSPPQLR